MHGTIACASSRRRRVHSGVAPGFDRQLPARLPTCQWAVSLVVQCQHYRRAAAVVSYFLVSDLLVERISCTAAPLPVIPVKHPYPRESTRGIAERHPRYLKLAVVPSPEKYLLGGFHRWPADIPFDRSALRRRRFQGSPCLPAMPLGFLSVSGAYSDGYILAPPCNDTATDM